MFAALPALSPIIAVTVSAVLGAVGMLVMGAVGMYAVSKIRARRAAGGVATTTAKKGILPGLFGGASAAANSPLVKQVEQVVVQAIHDSHHAALNAAVAKVFPGLAPFIPLIDKAADFGLAKVTGDQSTSGEDLVKQALNRLVQAVQAKHQAK